MSLWWVASANAAPTLASIFGDNMILQQGRSVPVWGWAEPQCVVTVRFAGQKRPARADANGRWSVNLSDVAATFTPQTLVVEAGETKTCTNILVGEVWLASGQSNMEKPVGLQPGQKPVFDYERELAAANFPNIRLFTAQHALSPTPRANLERSSGWCECSPATLDFLRFSAVAYFFGREIHTNLHVPVGVIESTWGGTRIEPWTPAPAGRAALVNSEADAMSETTPSAIYNAMIAPLTGFAVRGALWYQGENNYGDTNYDTKMEALVGAWRNRWDEGAFPFYFVQIAPYTYVKDPARYDAEANPLPVFWAQQSRAARRIKNCGMVVTTDLVDDVNDVHPRDKASVGHRLALLALDKTYKRKVICEGPVFQSMRVAGQAAILTFKHAESGLASKDGKPLTWFELAGADGRFVPAEARIVGRTVEVSAAGVEKPLAVRFAWSQVAQPNFCNGASLPAEPFSAQTPAE